MQVMLDKKIPDDTSKSSSYCRGREIIPINQTWMKLYLEGFSPAALCSEGVWNGIGPPPPPLRGAQSLHRFDTLSSRFVNIFRPIYIYYYI